MTGTEQPPQPPTDDVATPEREEFSAIQSRLNDIEAKIALSELSAEAKYRDLLIREIQQRISVRHWVIGVAIVVILSMGGVLMHAAHSYFWGPIVLIPASIVIVMFLAPIVSITTITVMLLIGAFRRFKDDDMDKVNVTSLAAEAVKGVQGGI